MKIPNLCAVCYLENPIMIGEIYHITYKADINGSVNIALSIEEPRLRMSKQCGYFDLTMLNIKYPVLGLPVGAVENIRFRFTDCAVISVRNR